MARKPKNTPIPPQASEAAIGPVLSNPGDLSTAVRDQSTQKMPSGATREDY